MKRETDLINSHKVLTIYLTRGLDFSTKMKDHELGQFIEDLKKQQWAQEQLQPGDEVNIFVKEEEESYVASY